MQFTQYGQYLQLALSFCPFSSQSSISFKIKCAGLLIQNKENCPVIYILHIMFYVTIAKLLTVIYLLLCFGLLFCDLSLVLSTNSSQQKTCSIAMETAAELTRWSCSCNWSASELKDFVREENGFIV